MSVTVQSVARACQILQVMQTQPERTTLTRIVEQTGLPHGTVHRLLHTLMDWDLVRQSENRTYALGSGLVSLGEAASAAQRV